MQFHLGPPVLIVRFLARLRASIDATAAFEFALVFPMMVAMWLGTLQLCDAYRADTLLYFAAQTAADVAADEVEGVWGNQGAELKNILYAATLEMYPYPTAGNFSFVIGSYTNALQFTGCAYYSDVYAELETDLPFSLPCTTVPNGGVDNQDWRDSATDNSDGTVTVLQNTGTITQPPTADIALGNNNLNEFLPIPGDSMIEVQATLNYTFGYSALLQQFGFQTGSYTMTQTAFARPRDGTKAKS